MADSKPAAVPARSRGLSLDTWAVIVALVAAALIRFGVIPRVPW